MRRIGTLIATLAVTLLLVAGCRTAAPPVGAQPSMEPATTTRIHRRAHPRKRACSTPAGTSGSSTLATAMHWLI